MNGPSRRPDYYSFGISGSRYGVSINVAHGGQVFVSLEADAGSPKPAPALPPGAANGSVSVAEGFVGPPSGAPPPDAYIARYLEGPSLDVALLLGPFGSNMSLSPGCGCPVSPQAGFEWGIDASAAQWLSSSVGGGVSCGIPVGTLPTLSELGPSDTGPWPHGGGASPSTVPAQKEADPLISRFVDAINDCMPHAAP
jgi:hypothetical protein